MSSFEFILIFSLCTPPLVLIWAWVTLPKGFVEPHWRAWVGFGSLVVITLDALAFIVAFVTVGMAGDFNQRVEYWLNWMKINRVVCLAVMLGSVLGKGRFRWASFCIAVALAFAAGVIFELK